MASSRGQAATSREAGTGQLSGAVPWHRWGTYLAERQWGTVREDYSIDGRAWDFFPYDHSGSRAYRWGEDGLLGLCDDQMRLCFALAVWNEADSHLKQRLFGLTGPQGNHGEDVKEYYWYLDGTPTHSYMRALYRYPQRAFPYDQLRDGNARRTRLDPELELLDTGVFADLRYFDVTVEYAKASPTDICIRITATNHGPDPAPLHLLPTLWFRNTWSWGRDTTRPSLAAVPGEPCAEALHPALGRYWLYWQDAPQLLFTENETNLQRLWRVPNRTPYTKDAIDAAVVNGRRDAVNPANRGTMLATDYRLLLGPGATETRVLRLSSERHAAPFAAISDVFADRHAEADEFYATMPGVQGLSEDERRVRRQAYAGLLWSKQVYIWDQPQWIVGDPAGPPPPPERAYGRNSGWAHFNTTHVLSVPDAWEYPWFAAWDLAFHCVPLAYVDPEFAKDQLTIMLREWYMHPNGQIPAYEWAFDDVNPPVHGWAAWRVYQIDRELTGTGDRGFLERVFHKLLLNFTWWVNRKDPNGLNVFQGGFLGLDNIGVFDRSIALPTGGNLEQSDGTAWMGMYCLNMLVMALELARENDAYEEIANKFFQHFLYVASAMNNVGGKGFALWDEDDEFFYDVLHTPASEIHRLRVRSLVGLIPLLAVETIEPDLLERMPQFKTRLEWVLANRPELGSLISRWHEPGLGERRLLALVRSGRMQRLLRRMLDPNEFLSDYGIRSVSKFHQEHPFTLDLEGARYQIGYEPAESRTGMFGGNSNWRGPVWMPINYLLIEALQKFHHYYGDDFLVECPTGSGRQMTLREISMELSRRLTRLFQRGEDGCRPVFGPNPLLQSDPHWRDNVLFYEYFHGDTGAGLGASHQTGWTALVANL
ncbi:MAG: glucosidase [Chloroflexi bacterium]|nr:glucosidase [Chloroflexota bacterium]